MDIRVGVMKDTLLGAGDAKKFHVVMVPSWKLMTSLEKQECYIKRNEDFRDVLNEWCVNIGVNHSYSC